MDCAPLQVIGLGAQTPLGRSAWASAAAARAGLCGFAEHPFIVDTVGEPMRIARVPWIGFEVQGVERYAALLFPAIEEAIAGLVATAGLVPLRLGLTLALPPPRPGRPVNLGDALLALIAVRCPGRFTSCETCEVGHAAGHLGFDTAMRGLAAAALDAYVICGVDSYLAPETLEWIDACDQLHGGGPLNNAWGFIPGEAAAAVLVGHQALAQRFGLDVWADIVGIGTGLESKRIKTEEVCIGQGLTDAFRGALRVLAPGEQIQMIYCDLNGEPYRADEYGFTALRTREHLLAAADFVAPADCWGDVGAAGGPLHIALATIAHCKRYGKGPLTMVWASSESGERGAAIVRACKPLEA